MKRKDNLEIMMRIDRQSLNRLDKLKLPIKKRYGQTKESYSDVVYRLLNDPRTRAMMERNNQEELK